MTTLKKTATFLVLFALTACGQPVEDGKTRGKAEKGISFKVPDIKEDFCGSKISFQYCKCAFHNQYCNAVDMDKKTANAHVQAEFATYVARLKDDFIAGCESSTSFVRGETCYVCESGSIVEEGQCIFIPEVEEIVEKEEQEPKEPEVVKADCGNLEEDWEKYSDIDFRIPEEERSFEAKNFASAKTELVNIAAQRAELQYETEILRGQYEEMLTYKAALVDNLRDNLVKATLRLTYTTYAQVKGAKGAGESFSKFLTSTKSIEALGAGMKAVQAVVPSDSKLAIDTNTAGGKMQSIGWNATLEAIESMGDPVAIGKQIVNDSKAAVMPSADISPEEVDILRTQHLENNLVNDILAEFEAEIADNEAWLSVADVRFEEIEVDIQKWKAEEKARVLLMLEEECE